MMCHFNGKVEFKKRILTRIKDILNNDHLMNLCFLKTRHNLRRLTNVHLAFNIPQGKGNLPRPLSLVFPAAIFSILKIIHY